MEIKIAITAGDGIGPEVVSEAVKVLEAISMRFGHELDFSSWLVGGCAIDKFGSAIEPGTIEACKKADAVLLGAVGGPKWDDPKAKVRPEDGLLQIRKDLGLFANLRPVKSHKALLSASTLKPEALANVDMVVVRELTGGLYFGKPKKRWETSKGRKAVDTMAYSEQEVERIMRVGFELARGRRKKLTSVDKANVLKTSQLWREVANEVAKEYADVKMDSMLVDTCAMRLVTNPAYFDVIVTENTFGDILTDEAAVLAGSMGMLPSASLGGKELIAGKGRFKERTFGLYEPIHGSAPDIAGQNKANPLATILSIALMLRYSFGLNTEAELIERTVSSIIDDGYRTQDLMRDGARLMNTQEMGALVASKVAD